MFETSYQRNKQMSTAIRNKYDNIHQDLYILWVSENVYLKTWKAITYRIREYYIYKTLFRALKIIRKLWNDWHLNIETDTYSKPRGRRWDIGRPQFFLERETILLDSSPDEYSCQINWTWAGRSVYQGNIGDF